MKARMRSKRGKTWKGSPHGCPREGEGADLEERRTTKGRVSRGTRAEARDVPD